MSRIDKCIVAIGLIVLGAIVIDFAWRSGFRQGQLKASLGIRYFFYDRNGSEVHDPRLELGAGVLAPTLRR